MSLESIGPAAILSPDATRVVFVSKHAEDRTRLFTKLLDQPKAVELAGTEDANAPFFSPDGQWVGFFAGGRLKKVSVDGSQLVALCDASVGRGASWSDDGSFIVAALDNVSGLSRIPADGGAPTALTKLNGEERSHRWPQVLPGHDRVLFLVNLVAGNFAESHVAVARLGNSPTAVSEHTILLSNAGMYPRVLGD